MKIIQNPDITRAHLRGNTIFYYGLLIPIGYFTSTFIESFNLFILFLIPTIIILCTKAAYIKRPALLTCNTPQWLGMLWGTQIGLYLSVLGMFGISHNVVIPPYTKPLQNTANLQHLLHMPLFPWPLATAVVAVFLAYLPTMAEDGAVYKLFEKEIPSATLRIIFCHNFHKRNECLVAIFTILALSILLFPLIGQHISIVNNFYILIPLSLIYYVLMHNDRLFNYISAHAKKCNLVQQISLIIAAIAITFIFGSFISKILPNFLQIPQSDFFTHTIKYFSRLSNQHAWMLSTLSVMIAATLYLSLFYIRISQGRRIIQVITATLIIPLAIYISAHFAPLMFNQLLHFPPMLYPCLTIIGSLLLIGIPMQRAHRWNNLIRIQLNTQLKPKRRSTYLLLKNLCSFYIIGFVALLIFGLSITAMGLTSLNLYALVCLPILCYISICFFRNNRRQR